MKIRVASCYARSGFSILLLFSSLFMGLDSFWIWIYFNTTIPHHRRLLTACNKDLENANSCLQVACLCSNGLSTAMVCSMKWVTTQMLFTHLATRVIMAKSKSQAVLTFRSRTWGKWTLSRRFFLITKFWRFWAPFDSNVSLMLAGSCQIVP
jgi:hypothetical protein